VATRTKLEPSRVQKPSWVRSAVEPDSACARMSVAYCSASATTHSPSHTDTTTSSSPAFTAAQAMRASDTPQARITTSSLLLASRPRPIRLPSRAASGISS
jgi:hypothetical protein